jgi:nitrate reductase gamma subunit
LPGKSLLCLACHNAPLSISNAGGFSASLYWGPLIILILGLISILYVWSKGAVGHGQQTFHNKVIHYGRTFWDAISTRNIFKYVKTFLLDIFLQRKILAEGVQRWSIHSLIYLAFLLRFLMSLFAVILYKIWPDSSLSLIFINKNNPFIALSFDLLGLCILLGIIWASIQRFVIRPEHFSQEQDSPALIIIGLLVLSGFILEGFRIAMTQIPFDKAAFSFVGALIAQGLDGLPREWPRGYSYLWYSHAILWAVFLIYLPFGKLKHILITPLNLLLNTEVDKQKQ